MKDLLEICLFSSSFVDIRRFCRLNFSASTFDLACISFWVQFRGLIYFGLCQEYTQLLCPIAFRRRWTLILAWP
jgi:hypothetical protein